MGVASPTAHLENATWALWHHEILRLAPSPQSSKGCALQGAACQKSAVLQEVLLGPIMMPQEAASTGFHPLHTSFLELCRTRR